MDLVRVTPHRFFNVEWMWLMWNMLNYVKIVNNKLFFNIFEDIKRLSMKNLFKSYPPLFAFYLVVYVFDGGYSFL
jgi:hypothetical protein